MLRAGWQLAAVCPGWVAAYLALSLLTQVAMPQAIPVIYGRLITGAAQGQSLQGLFWVWVTVTLAALALGVLGKAVAANMDGHMKTSLRSRLFNDILRRPPDFFREYDAGKLNVILNQLGVEAHYALRSLAIDPVVQVVGILSATVLISLQLPPGSTSLWAVACILVLGPLPTWAIVRWSGKAVEKGQSGMQAQRLQLGTLIDGAVNGPQEIQAMVAEKFFGQRHTAALDGLRKTEVRQGTLLQLVNATLQFPEALVMAVLLGLLVYRSGVTSMNPGMFAALLLLTPQAMTALRALASLGVIARVSRPAVDTVLSLLETPSAPAAGKAQVAHAAPAPPIVAGPGLQASNVYFAYGPEKPLIFKGLDFAARPGRITGLVGRSGQGKTTLFKLALRFHEPASGQISLDEKLVVQLDLPVLRGRIAMMSQFPIFFHSSVWDNFMMACPDATPQDVREMCQRTGIWPYLQAVLGPEPLDKPFGSGAMLSGGLRKLFALTRCLLRRPDVILLDEPTTGMDNELKYPLIGMMRRACEGKTVVVVDHDIRWLAQFCDEFVVIENGQAVQRGTLDELKSQPGLFKELYDAPDAPQPISAQPRQSSGR